jgi:hypothetical protein
MGITIDRQLCIEIQLMSSLSRPEMLEMRCRRLKKQTGPRRIERQLSGDGSNPSSPSSPHGTSISGSNNNNGGDDQGLDLALKAPSVDGEATRTLATGKLGGPFLAPVGLF